MERRKRVGIYARSLYVDAGGLMSYESIVSDPYAIRARHIALLANGVPANEIPVEGPSDFVLAINLDAAKRIGLALPVPLIKTASRVVFSGSASVGEASAVSSR